MTQTLGALIESGDFTGYNIESAEWHIDAAMIENLLYGRYYAEFQREHEHGSTFFEKENLTVVEINTWLCTDRDVGLKILCLNGTPVGLSWQTGRKSDPQVSLLTPATRDLFIEAWERHRPASGEGEAFVSPESLVLPIAGPGEKPFEIDNHSKVRDLRLSTRGLLSWMQTLEPEGGLSSVCDIELLTQVRETIRADIANQHRARNQFDDNEAAKKPENAELIAAHKNRADARIEETQAHLLDPVERRLAQLGVV